MGWKTCLPAVCVTNTSIHVSHRISQAFEENPFSEESIQFVSAFEFCNKDKKSSHKYPSFMCDYCAYSSESKMNLFEHFIKSHVFLCTLCSYAGVSRSSILKHCFESHNKVMEEKMHHLKSYKLNVDKLLGELDISSKGYSDFTTSSSFNEFYNNSDCSSDEEYPESSFLAKSRTKGSWNAILSSDEDSEIENERGKSSHHKSKFKPILNHHSKESKANSSSFSQDKDSDHGTNSRENILHFLDTTHSQKDEEDDYNEFSDSSQMDYFFSQQGNDNDPDLGESIFHDHKEMFMVSRLPFPIRQDDSPNDPFNEVTHQPETSSTILQSILQRDKQEPADGAGSSSSGINSSSEKVSETTREPESKSISPGLSIPTGETLQKQFETAMSESTVFNYSDTMSQEVVDLTSNQPVTEDCVQSLKEGLDVIETLPLSAEKDTVETLTKSSQDGKNVLDNFLLPPSYDTKERTNEENSHKELAPQRENTNDKEGKFILLRNLLKDKHKPDDNQVVEKYENSKKNTQAPKKNTEAPVPLKNASDMSLHELLSMDTPFPLSTRPNVQKDNAGSNDDSHSLHSVTLECDVCEQTFFNKSIFERHVKICTVKKHSPTLVQRKNDISGKNKHSLLSHHIQSSMRTGHFTSKVVPKISKSPLELALATGKSMPLSEDIFKANNNNKLGASFSRPSLKYRRTRPQNLLSQQLQVKHRNRKWDQPRDTEAVVVGDGPEVRTMKRKLEQDKDYDPESESSETSDDVTADSIKQRKKAKRVRKHIISSIRQQKPKISSAVTLMSKLCEKALGDQIANASSENSSLLSSSFSSSSSILSSSLSSSASSLLSNSQTVVGLNAQKKEMESILSSSNQHSKGIDTKLQECSIVGITKVSVKTEAEKNVECEDEQTSSSVQIRNTSLASNTNHKSSSQTLLQHLLIMPTNTMHYPQELSQKTSSSLQSIGVLKYNKQSAEKCNDKQKRIKGVPVEIKNESNGKNGLQLHPRPLDLVLPGPNSNKTSKFVRSRSQSLTEVEIRTDAFCKETKQTCLGPRLSASMMDVPDPPTLSFSSDDLESLKPPGLPLLLPPLSPPPSSQSWSIKPQVLSQYTSNIPSLKRQEPTGAKANIKSTIQASRLDFLPCPSSEPAMCAVNTSTSTTPALTVSAYSSLLRNLLMQHSDTSGGKH